MKRRELGQTGIEISPIGLGVMQFAGGQGALRMMFPGMAASEMEAIVCTAVEGGISWFDTGEPYGSRRSQGALSETLEDAGVKHREVLVAAGWSPFLKTARRMEKTTATQLHNLAPYTIGLFQIQSTWSFSSLTGLIRAAADLLEAGRIRAVGGSGFNPRQMRLAHRALAEQGWPLASNQVQYSLLNRAIETNGVLDAARELGMTLIASAPLGSGLLTGRYHRDPEILSRIPAVRRRRLQAQLDASRPIVEALESIAGAHQTEPAQVALSWVIHGHGDQVLALPGASRVDHSREGVEALQVILTGEEIERLDNASRLFL